MRHRLVPALLATALILSGCSRTTPDVALAPTSTETTASIAAVKGPRPRASVPGESAPQVASTSGPVPVAGLDQETHELAWAGGGVNNEAFRAMAPAERPTLPEAIPSPSRKRATIYAQQFRDAKPINFGKVKPKHYPVHGVDVSRWQGDIDWMKLRTQGANFAYIKATDGGDHIDPMFRKNWNNAKAAGLKRGAYHFFYWCRTAGEQAEWFIRNVPNDPDALPPVIDVEYNGESSCKFRLSSAKAREKMQVFMDMLERHYGKRPVIYTAPDFYKDNLRGHFQNYPFWLRAVAQHPSKVYPDRKWVFWQYSGSGLSHGVKEKIDLNVFNGSPEAWHNWSTGQSAVASR